MEAIGTYQQLQSDVVESIAKSTSEDNLNLDLETSADDDDDVALCNGELVSNPVPRKRKFSTTSTNINKSPTTVKKQVINKLSFIRFYFVITFFISYYFRQLKIHHLMTNFDQLVLLVFQFIGSTLLQAVVVSHFSSLCSTAYSANVSSLDLIIGCLFGLMLNNIALIES
jgi:hypothetical protein